jgi:AraC-like DNA-binding protein
MIPTTFRTRSVRPLDQLQSWQDWFSPVFDISPIEQVGDEFHAQNVVWSLGDVMISRVVAPSVHVKRKKINLSKAPTDHWVLTYCRQGATDVQTPKGEFNAAGGVPFLWSLGEEFESKRTRVDRIQIMMSRGALSSLTPLLEASRGSALATPWGALLGDYIIAVERSLPSMQQSDVPRLAASIRSMIAACIAPSAEHSMLAQEEIEGGLSERARRAIQAHLRSPQLRPATLSRLLGISRSQLYRLFERTGGVAQYIQRQRLLGVWALLSDPNNERAIADIAADFCFEDASSFGRAFRREFGHSASDVRSAARAGVPLAATRRNELQREAARFADLFAGS